jgi:arylsulfatase A-like enzyme
MARKGDDDMSLKNGGTFARHNTLARRDFLKIMGLAGACHALDSRAASGVEAGAAKARRPNIVLIVADDLGYADLGVQGCKDIPTPNIDSIAQNGVRFTNGYASCPVCSPTRAGLMTGRYQQRFGHEFNPGSAEAAVAEFGLPLTEVTLAERLKTLGYATGMFGKWHLGYRPEMHPQKRGFDEFYGFLGGAHDYLNAAGDKSNPILRGTERVPEVDYTTDVFAREAVAFIDRHRDEPFFVYLPFNAVHLPLEALDKYKSRFAAIEDKKRHVYAAMLSAMDDGVGQVLAKLRERGLEENTMVFFISDNGGPTPQTTSSNQPLRGYKGQVLEGGIRVPFFVQWKGHIPAGKVDGRPVVSLDIHPTALAVAGAASQESGLDGVSLLPLLTQEKDGAPHESLFWRFGEQSAVRVGDWKLLQQKEGAPQLYNLAEDIGEAKDLAGANPDKVKELQSAYDGWNAKNIPALWKAGRPGKDGRKRLLKTLSSAEPDTESAE